MPINSNNNNGFVAKTNQLNVSPIMIAMRWTAASMKKALNEKRVFFNQALAFAG